MRAVLTLTRREFLLMRRDPAFIIIFFAMPLVVMPLFERTMGLSLQASGFSEASGAEQVVPGQVVLFGFFIGSSVAFAVFREHGWKTWDRLRASAVSPRAVLAGFALPWVVLHVVYQLALMVAGGLFLGLRLNGGSAVAVVAVTVAYAVCVIALVLLITATFRTANQVNGITNLLAMVLSGLGGALVPRDQLPGWAQAVAPATPQYWAMEGHRQVFLESGGLADVIVPVVVLLGAGLVLGLLAAVRFRADETKEFFA
ncbi:MAG: ABC transporter permease [Actinomycetia bacterium]|nr:ABC transporter permease [Actinomycetes bacterium]